MARSIAAPAPPSTLSGVARPLKGLAQGLAHGLGYGVAGLAHAIATGAGFVRAHRRLRIVLIAVVAIVAVAAAGWQLARHTSLSAVEQVQVSGLTTAPGTESGAIEAALRGTARGMSTLGVNQGALRAAVAQYPIVREVRARARFPHGLRIEVVEQPPVAALVVGGERTAVAADGVVLGPSYLSSALPQVNVVASTAASTSTSSPSSSFSTSTSTTTTSTSHANPIATLPAAGRSVTGRVLLDELAVLGAAPGPLAREATHVYMGSKGLTVALRGGVQAYFGDATRAHAKWISLARVLASPTSAGAGYVDVRLPERPAAGWAPGAIRPGAGSSESEPPGAATGEAPTADPTTAAELAAGLDAAVSGSAGTSTSTSTESSPGATGEGSGEETESVSESGAAATPAASAEAAPGEAESTG
jgi:cell division protein FtsQ